jgi:hypothetical protein
MLRIAIGLSFFLVLSCASKVLDDGPAAKDTVEGADAPPKDAGSEGETTLPDTKDPNLPVWDTVEVEECAAKGAGDQSCYFTYRYDPLKCGAKGCSRLMVFFAGAQNSCPQPANESAYLGKIAKMGYAAVCARIYKDSQGSGEFPYHLEAERVDALLLAITEKLKALNAWSGKNLLLTGASDGATAPVIAMARTALDEQAHWKGSNLTGACFFDGIYDIPEALNYLYDNECQLPVSYKQVFSRYCPWTAEKDIDPTTWPEPNSCVTSAVVNDSITELPGDAYAVDHWKLVSCGSSGDPCTIDIIPGGPIEALCTQINNTPGKNCEFKAYNFIAHSTCGRILTNAGACWQWFNALK